MATPLRYEAIKLPQSLTGEYEVSKSEVHENPIDVLPGLSHINVFVGQNNAGKSRLMRKLFKEATLDFRSSFDPDFAKELHAFNAGLADIITRSGYNNFSFHEPGQQIGQGTKESFRVNLGEFNSSNANLRGEIQDIKNFRDTILKATQMRWSSATGSSMDPQMVLSLLKEVISKNKVLFDKVDRLQWTDGKFHKYYIPILRSLNNFTVPLGAPRNIYKESVKASYGLDEGELHTIFTGQDLYDRFQNMLLGTREDRDRVHEFEGYLSEALFDGREIVLMPRIGDNKEFHIGIDGQERAYYELGDGIQALILLTFPLFEKEAAQFFIEEPEMHLHPGMQRKLIQVMKDHPKHQFFATTHSNHFLDLTLESEDVSLYTLRENEGKKCVSLITFGDESALQLLGAQNTSVFITNASVWVEGITDRLYIRKYLELYQLDKDIKIQEDIDFSFVEYGGDNITHWSFLDQEDAPINIERLCGKSILIADQDDPDKKLERKRALEEKLGDRFVMLDSTEIENTLPLQTIFEVVQEYEEQNNGSLDEAVLESLDEDAHSKVRLGSFIHEHFFGGGEPSRRGGYTEDSGTIKDKGVFAKKAVERLDTLTPEAERIAKKIYDFVLSQRT